MRRMMIAAAMALGLIALWAAILPLTAQPAPMAPAASPVLSKALFLCRGPHGIDRACTTALAQALILESSDAGPAHASDRYCHADPSALASRD
jgi:hypothetical protein